MANNDNMCDDKYIYRPDVLVIGPGSQKGYYELGALAELENRGTLKNISIISTCSVGSIFGLLMMVGYSALEMMEIVLQKNILDILGKINLENIIFKGGLFDIKELTKLLEDLVIKKLGYIPTMKSLYVFSNIEFCVVVTNLNKKGYKQYITYLSEPEMSCIDAVILSSDLPLVFERLEYKGDSITDGAWSDPYPINIYDDGKREILGIFIDEKLYTQKVKNNFKFINHLIDSYMSLLRENNIEKCSKKCYHLCLTVSSQVSSHINPTKKDKRIMMKRGILLTRDCMIQIENLKTLKIKTETQTETQTEIKIEQNTKY